MIYSSGRLKKIQPKRGEKDTVFTLIVGDGRVGPFFFVTKNKKIPTNVIPSNDSKITVIGNVARRGERTTLAFLEDAVRRGTLEPGDLLLSDNEGALKTEEVQYFLRSHHIDFDYFPVYMGSLMNPCDNSFHSVFKHNLHQLLSEKMDCSIGEKVKLCYDAYKMISEDSIRNMYSHVGLRGRDPKRTVENLLLEGCHLTPKWKKAHMDDLHLFQHWKQSKSSK